MLSQRTEATETTYLAMSLDDSAYVSGAVLVQLGILPRACFYVEKPIKIEQGSAKDGEEVDMKDLTKDDDRYIY